MSKLYDCLPSQVIGIEDDYTAFCFNEACCEIQLRLQNKEKPVYMEQRRKEADKPKEFSNFKDFYKVYGG